MPWEYGQAEGIVDKWAKKYGIAIQQVIGVEGKTFSLDAWADWYGDKQQGVCVNSGVLDGLAHKDAVAKVALILNSHVFCQSN